jgi:two-component system nitrate/nitrite response regulator NarL
MIRVLVIENHEAIIVSGLRQMFRPQRDLIEITASAVSVASALKTAEDSAFDMIMLDLWIPGEKPLENVRLLKEHFRGKPILVFSSEDSAEWIRKMAVAGVMGYVIKDAARNELKNAIVKVAAGNTWFTGLTAAGENDNLLPGHPRSREPLSLVQKSIIGMLIDGRTLKEIADKLAANPNQIEKTLVRMRLKYNAKSNVELIKILIDLAVV